MEPLLIILIPGLLGGFVVALLIFHVRLGSGRLIVDRRLAPPSPALINMARIRVEGLGGLGMVAAVVAVAIVDPRIRVAMAMASLLGVLLAAVLIALRRHSGALASGGHGPGADSILGLDRGRGRAADVSRSTARTELGGSRLPVIAPRSC
jgi:hypothetical protein